MSDNANIKAPLHKPVSDQFCRALRKIAPVPSTSCENWKGLYPDSVRRVFQDVYSSRKTELSGSHLDFALAAERLHPLADLRVVGDLGAVMALKRGRQPALSSKLRVGMPDHY